MEFNMGLIIGFLLWLVILRPLINKFLDRFF